MLEGLGVASERASATRSPFHPFAPAFVRATRRPRDTAARYFNFSAPIRGVGNRLLPVYLISFLRDGIGQMDYSSPLKDIHRVFGKVMKYRIACINYASYCISLLSQIPLQCTIPYCRSRHVKLRFTVAQCHICAYKNRTAHLRDSRLFVECKSENLGSSDIAG